MKNRSRSGFTLFEVLAAVAVLGLVYVTLASTAMDGLRAEGEASRRLEASLMADRALAEIEFLAASGVAPTVGTTESESEDGRFFTFVEVAPYSLDELASAGFDPQQRGSPEPRDLPLVVASGTGNPTALLSVNVQVRWQEGVGERDVSRATFLFDSAAAAPLLEAIPGPDEESAGEGDADDDGDEEATGADERPERAGRTERVTPDGAPRQVEEP